jgi:hypothetical protein
MYEERAPARDPFAGCRIGLPAAKCRAEPALTKRDCDEMPGSVGEEEVPARKR